MARCRSLVKAFLSHSRHTAVCIQGGEASPKPAPESRERQVAARQSSGVGGGGSPGSAKSGERAGLGDAASPANPRKRGPGTRVLLGGVEEESSRARTPLSPRVGKPGFLPPSCRAGCQALALTPPPPSFAQGWRRVLMAYTPVSLCVCPPGGAAGAF